MADDHVLAAAGVAAHEPRRPLLAPTSLEVRTGELLVAAGDPGHGHTLLALALAGRLGDGTGAVTLDGEADRAALQDAVALVDVPGVSEPDPVLPLTTVAGEELAMAGRPATPAAVRRWLTERGLGDQVGARIEDLDTRARVAALAGLAAARPRVRFLVLVLPERSGGRPEDWAGTVRALADRGFGVVVTASPGVADAVDARTTQLGNDLAGSAEGDPGKD